MKRLVIYVILLSIFASAYAKNGDANCNGSDDKTAAGQGRRPHDDIARMERYNQLYRLFDSPLWEYGISDVSSIPSVKAWDFDLFSDYIIQEGEETLNLGSDTFIKNKDEQSLTIRLSEDMSEAYPFPANALKISFNGSLDDDTRTLSLTYLILTTKDNQDNIFHKCLDLLANTWKEESDSGLYFSGPYRHLYTIGKDNDSILFTCNIPVPASLWYHIPAGYMPEISYATLPEHAPCNSGKEPFSQFLKKFNKDAAFRVEHRANSDRSNYAEIAAGYYAGTQFGFNELVLTALSESGLLPLRGHYSHKEYKAKKGSETEEKESCGQWFYPTTNSVIYSGWKIDTGNPADDCSIIILFERVDNEWNTTATWYSGKRLNDIVTRLMKDKYE